MTNHNPPDPYSRYSTQELSACYDINTKYFGVTNGATMAVELPTTQIQACQEANGQFCSITTPFQPLANPPSWHSSSICKKQGGYHLQMLSVQIHKASATNLPTQIAPDVWILTTPVTASIEHHDIDMSGEAHGNHSYPETNAHTEATYGLQYHLI